MPSSASVPGTCAHFVIDRDGTIYQLVPLSTICRHTVGLNWTAIGIEHVGTSDASILGNPRQLRASLKLTLWLMGRYRISLPNVIGHAESLTSRYHRERYAPWRCQTHGDWQHADMVTYRTALARLARAQHVAVSRAGGPVASSLLGRAPRRSRAPTSARSAPSSSLRRRRWLPSSVRLSSRSWITVSFEKPPSCASISHVTRLFSSAASSGS